MLIKVFGYQVNSENINFILNQHCRTNDGGKTYLPDCRIYFRGSSDNEGLFINDKTADEVAAEINRQIEGERNDK